MKKPATILRVTRDIKNPCHDRRTRYGFESFDVIPAGTLVRIWQAGDRLAYPVVYILRPGKTDGCPVNHKAVSLLSPGADGVEPGEPRTATELLFAEDFSEGAFAAILDQLFEIGAVSPETLRAGLQSLRAKWDAQEVAA